MANKLREWANNPAVSGEKISKQLLTIASIHVDNMVQNIDNSDLFWKNAEDAVRVLNSCRDFHQKLESVMSPK